VAAALTGTSSDDGLPNGSTLTTIWSKVSGPGTATFGNANSANTTVTFSAAGSYVLRLSASDGSATVHQDLMVTAAGEDFASWIAGQGVAGGQTGARDDPDGDGIPNLIEYALGGDPTDPSARPGPVAGTSGGKLTLTFTPQRVNGLSYIIEASPDMSDWSDATDVTPLLTAGQSHAHTDSALISNTQRRFLRLKVVEIP
jgi:hypothetical protein